MSHNIVSRILKLPNLTKRRSWFLLGPRMTGKSTLIRETLPDATIFDLLSAEDFLAITQDPSYLESSLRPETELVVIDEIQKAPQLLDEVHRLIEKRRIPFLLTGSSARKLRRGGVNLLGGRAGTIHLHPLLLRELGAAFNLDRALEHGTLPAVYLSDDPHALLANYVGTYLKEEINAEGLSRNLPAFARFLDLAAHCNATIVNFSSLASDAQVPRTTVHGYFQILKDTLLVRELPAAREVSKRKAVTSSKYYFFDVGVAMAMQRQSPRRFAYQNGFAFETWLLHELQSWIDYCDRTDMLRYWKSRSGFEVDFLIGDHTAIEAKAKRIVNRRDLRSLDALRKEEGFRNYLCVCMEPRPRNMDGIEILPYQMFLDQLWDGFYDG